MGNRGANTRGEQCPGREVRVSGGCAAQSHPAPLAAETPGHPIMPHILRKLQSIFDIAIHDYYKQNGYEFLSHGNYLDRTIYRI